MTGSHRTALGRQEPRRRSGLVMAAVAAGAIIGVVAVIVIFNSVINTGPSTDVANGSTVESSPVSATPEQGAVPEACSAVPKDVTDRLVPGAQMTQTDPFDADDEASQCTWGSYGGRSRQLTVQLRAVAGKAGQPGSTAADRELRSERKADEAGKGLRDGQRVTIKKDVKGIGDEGYAVYSEAPGTAGFGDGYGEGIVNVRIGDILVTVHYAGTQGSGAPLSSAAAINGGIRAAQRTAAAL